MQGKRIKSMEQKLEKQNLFQQFQKLSNDLNTQWHFSEHSYLLRWYTMPGKDEEIDKMLFKQIAKQYQIIFEVADLKLPDANLRMISVSGVQQSNLLNQFLNHSIKIFPPMPLSVIQKYKILKSLTYNRYGSFQNSYSFQCIICLDKKVVTSQSCCGKAICQKCDSPQICHYCRQKPIRRRFILKEEIKDFNQFTEKLWAQFFREIENSAS